MRANTADLAKFFSARERVEAVDDWFSERQAALVQQAEQRRSVQRRACGQALQSMRDRGEPMSEIVRMAGIAEKTARELIREAEAGAEAGAAPDTPPRLRVVGSAAGSGARAVDADVAAPSTGPAVSAQP